MLADSITKQLKRAAQQFECPAFIDGDQGCAENGSVLSFAEADPAEGENRGDGGEDRRVERLNLLLSALQRLFVGHGPVQDRRGELCVTINQLI